MTTMPLAKFHRIRINSSRIPRLWFIILLFLAFAADGQIQQVNWSHLSSATGELPVPPVNDGQSGLRVVDLDKNGQNDYVLTLWSAPQAVVWYRRLGDKFEPYVIDTLSTNLSNGERLKDIDGDGDEDLLFGDASLGNRMYWWENPYPNYVTNTPWVRRIVRDGGGNFYHDNIWADFDGDGQDELISWNQYGLQLLLFEIPSDPKTAALWPVTPIFSWTGNPLTYKGADAADINLDGKVDFVGGGGWFEHISGTNFAYHLIDRAMGYAQIKAAQLIPGGRPEVVCVLELQNGPLNLYEWTGDQWLGRTLLSNVPPTHTLQIGDINQDGNLDIMTAELAQPHDPPPPNPGAKISVLYGDGTGHFTQQSVFLGQGDLEGQLADIDNDGDLDIVAKPFRHNAPRVDIYVNESFAPTILPNGGTFHGQTTVSLSSQAGNAIYYTTNGSAPTTNSILYSGPFTLNTSGTVNAVSAANGTILTNSSGTNALSRATFTINRETIAPSMLSVEAALSSNQVTILFSEPVDQATSETAMNYTINNGVAVVSASLDSNLRTVHLTTSPLSPSVGYMLTVENVKDRCSPANTIAFNSQRSFSLQGVPTQNLALWLKANQGTVPSGPAISQWQDQSGKNRHAIQRFLLFSQPLLIDQSINGLPALRFDGVNDFLTFPLPVNGLNGMTVFLVAANTQNQDGGPNYSERQALFWNETAYWGTVSLGSFQSSVTLRFGTTQASNGIFYARPSSVGSSFTLSTALKNGTNDSLYVNGTLVVSQDGKLSMVAGCRDTANLGRGYNDNTYYAGDIAEVLVYDRALSEPERQSIEQYLDSKYSLLPPSAPQITSQPASVTVFEPLGVTFSVGAVGTAPLSYQWQRGGSLIPGAFSNSYSLSPTSVANDNGAQFSVVVSNALGSVTSVVATLTVTTVSSFPQNGMTLWLRADAGIVSGALGIAQWIDQSSNNRHAVQASGVNQPSLASGVVKGLPAVRFDGVNDFLTFTLPVNGLSGMTIFLVAANTQNQDAGPNYSERQALFWNETAYWGTVSLSSFQSNVTMRFGTTQASNGIFYARPSSVRSNFTLSTALKDGTTDSLYVNRTLVVSQGGKLSTIAGCRDTASLGRGYNDNTFFAGDIAEVLVYDRALSESERQSVEQYLDGKYGLTMPAQPRLTIEPVGAKVRLSWPAATSNYILEAKEELRNGSWTATGETPVIEGGRSVVTNSATSPRHFYRLRYQ